MFTGWKLQRMMAEMTQKQAAGAAGISVHRYRQIERGAIKLDPKSKEYDHLARAMPIKRPGPQRAGDDRAEATA